MPLADVQAALIRVFRRHGMPSWLKVDHGRPFADPKFPQVTPVLSLWLIGMGIRMVYNRVRTPQDNAKVERSQGVLARWSEYEKCAHLAALQARLLREATFHAQHYPVRRLGGQTRWEHYPELRCPTRRPFHPADFDLQRVLDFLAQRHWQRTVSSTGQIQLWRIRYTIGLAWKHQQVSVKLEPKRNTWQIFAPTGQLLKEYPTPFTADQICKLDLS